MCQTYLGPIFSVYYACYFKLGKDVQYKVIYIFTSNEGSRDLGLDDEASIGLLLKLGDEEVGDKEVGDKELGDEELEEQFDKHNAYSN